MNFLPCTAHQDNVALRLETADGQHFALPTLAEAAIGPTREVIFGVRPEDIELDPTGHGRASLQATADVIEPLGADTMVVMRVGGRPVTMRARPDIQIAPQDAVSLSVGERGWSIFDAGSGKALYHA